jgi:hypothetical protein
VIRRASTVLELAATLALVLFIVSGTILTVRAFAARSDEALADAVLHQVVLTQQSLATATGSYVWGPGDDDSERDANLSRHFPETVLRDLTVTHAESKGMSSVSMAVGREGTLAAAVLLTDGRCRIAVAGAPASGAPVELRTEPTVRCLASTLLPSGEDAAWE